MRVAPPLAADGRVDKVERSRRRNKLEPGPLDGEQQLHGAVQREAHHVEVVGRAYPPPEARWPSHGPRGAESFSSPTGPHLLASSSLMLVPFIGPLVQSVASKVVRAALSFDRVGGVSHLGP